MARKKKAEVVVELKTPLTREQTLQLHNWLHVNQKLLNTGSLTVEEAAEMAADDLDYEVPMDELQDVLAKAPGLTAKFLKPAEKQKIDQEYVANLVVKVARLEDRVQKLEDRIFGRGD